MNKYTKSPTMAYFHALWIILLVLIIGIVGQCTNQEQEAAAEAQVSILDEAARVEVMSRLNTYRVEQAWREKYEAKRLLAERR